MKTMITTLVLTLATLASVTTAFADFGRPGFGPGRRGPHRPDFRPRQQYVNCSSWGMAFASCPVQGYIRYAEVANQESRSACILGRSYGYQGNQLWVNHGCRATFLITLQ